MSGFCGPHILENRRTRGKVLISAKTIHDPSPKISTLPSSNRRYLTHVLSYTRYVFSFSPYTKENVDVLIWKPRAVIGTRIPIRVNFCLYVVTRNQQVRPGSIVLVF